MSMTGFGNYAEHILTVQYFRETSLFLNYIQQILKTSVSRGVKWHCSRLDPEDIFLRLGGYRTLQMCVGVERGGYCLSCRLYTYITNVSLDWADISAVA